MIINNYISGEKLGGYDAVIRIREYSRKKNGKKQSLVLD